MISERELVHFAMWNARCEINRHCTRESCLYSCKILGDIYRDMGLSAIPLVTSVKAMSVERRASERAGTEPVGIGVLTERKDDDDPAWEEWEDHKHEAGSPWPGGHIILVVNARYLVDVSADQFSYDEHDLKWEPFVHNLGSQAEGYIDGSETVEVSFDDGTAIHYLAHPEDQSYLRTPDWTEGGKGDALHDRVFDQVTGLVAAVEGSDRLPALPALPRAFRFNEVGSPEFMGAMDRSREELEEYDDFEEERGPVKKFKTPDRRKPKQRVDDLFQR